MEDLVMDVLGAGTAAAISAARLDDLIGFHRGFLLPPSGNATCCKVPERAGTTRMRSRPRISRSQS
jgi:hypothetical protein